jgi:DNA-binding MarR family transcriptional regulator
MYTEDDSLGYLLNRADLKVKNHFQRLIKSCNVTREQWTILSQLYDADGISQKELSEHTFKDQAAVTRMLDAMERKGLVRREVNPADRRAFSIYLTDRGKALRNKIVPFAEQCLWDATAGMAETEVCALKTLLRKVEANLD